MATADASPSSRPSPAGPKVCSVCGEDCSAKARSKDAQGRYVCGDCVAKASAAKASAVKAGAATAGGAKPAGAGVSAAATGRAGTPPARQPAASAADDDVMSKLVNESLELGKHGCPNCHARMKQAQTICVNCGYNRESGKMLRTVEQKPVVLKEAKVRTSSGSKWGAGSTGPSLGRMLLVSAGVQSLIGAFALQGLTGAWGAFAFLLLFSLAFTIMGVVYAFMEGETFWAICGIAFIIPGLNLISTLAFTFYVFFVCESRSLKAGVGGNLIGFLVWGVCLVVGAVLNK